MTTLTRDRMTERKQGVIYALPAAAGAHIFAGALTAVNASGYVVPAADAAGTGFLGVARVEANNAAGADGALTAEGYLKGIFHFNAPGTTAADLAKEAYVVDDNTVGKGIVAQPVNVTGVTVHRTPLSAGGTRTLSYTATGTLLAYGGGTALDVGAGGEFTLAAADGGNIAVTVAAGSLPVGNAADSLQLRHLRVGRFVEVMSGGQAFVEIIPSPRA